MVACVVPLPLIVRIALYSTSKLGKAAAEIVATLKVPLSDLDLQSNAHGGNTVPASSKVALLYYCLRLSEDMSTCTWPYIISP